MHLTNLSGSHLTYCTNIHPGESWKDHFSQLRIHLPELKKRLSPDKPFGTGLRLSARAASRLLEEDHLESFRSWLDSEEIYLFTINGFPYGSFHHQRVKDSVYRPDWQSEKRLSYTLNLIAILAELLPEGVDGGISTSPLSYKYWPETGSSMGEIYLKCTNNLAEAAYAMYSAEERTGREIHLDIEPEPDCVLENSSETIEYFTERLFPMGSDYLAKRYGLDREKAADLLKRHIGICYDTCHFAVEYEDPRLAVRRIREAGIRIGKAQISAALKIDLGHSGPTRKTIAARLKEFDEPTYLHQVIERKTDGTFTRYRDLPEALPNIYNSNAAEWRVHYHVPIFTGEFGVLQSTQDHIPNSLAALFESGCTHFEIETYTWGVLPEGLKTGITDSIEREYRWFLGLEDSMDPTTGKIE